MGRLVKKSEQDAKQSSLLGFFRRPLGDVNATRESTAAPSKPEPTIVRADGDDAPVESTGPSGAIDATAAAPSCEDRAGDDLTTAPNAPRTHPSQRPPLRMADALVRIERAINGWERLFASHERAKGDERAKEESARASRTAECARALRVEAYRHRIETRRESRGARQWTRSLRARQHRGDGGRGKRTLENAGISLNVDRLREVGTCTLPANPNEGSAVSAAGDPTLSLSFNPTGAYLAAATAGGQLAVQSWDTMRCSGGLLYEPRFQRRGARGNPSIHRSLTSVAWRQGRDVVATASGDGGVVEIIDLGAGGTTTRTLLADTDRGSSAFRTGDGQGAGLLDVLFCPGEGNRVLAAGRRGRVYLWDDRCAGGQPRAELTAPTDRDSPFNCARASDDGQTVIAGSGRGMVHVWDLRGGTGGTKARAAAFSFGSQNKTSHQLLRSVDVAELLAQVPVIRDGPTSGPSRSAVHWCEQDPNDQRRIGFHLARGWSGVIDMSGPRGWGGVNWTGPLVTHAHCPPSQWEVSDTGSGEAVLAPGVCGAALAHRRTGAWVTAGDGGGSAVAVGCPGRDGVRVLDFSPAPGAGHWVAGLDAATLAREEEEEAALVREADGCVAAEAREDEGEDVGGTEDEGSRRARTRARRGRWWRDGAVESSGPTFAMAAHPLAPDVLVAGSWGTINLVGHR